MGSPLAAIDDTGNATCAISSDAYGTEKLGADGAGADRTPWQQNPWGYKSGTRSSADNCSNN